jgi:hypothetical protein
MDATGIASVAGAVLFGGTVLRYGWRQLDADVQARAQARRRAEWAGWEHHSTCVRLRTAGDCVGLPTEREPAAVEPVPLGPGLVGPVVVEPGHVPDYVPDVLVGEVLADMVARPDDPRGRVS